MTQSFPDQTSLPTAPDNESSEPSGTAGVAKDQAAAVGHNAAEAGQHVAAVAKDQTKNVATVAGTQAKDLLQQTRTELTDQAGVQQQRLAAGLHALGDELHSMTQHSESPGVATGLARQGASRSHDAASWLEEREPGSLVDEIKTFARRRPGAFLLVAAGAGLLAGRLTRGVKDASSSDDVAVTPASAAPAAAMTPVATTNSASSTDYDPEAGSTGWSGVSEYDAAQSEFPLLDGR